MKKVSILAATVLVAVGCNKKTLEMPAAPVYPDMEAPVSFGATAHIDVIQSKATSTLPKDTQLGVYAFKATGVPTTADDANSALWSGASNLQYVWNDDAFKESGTSPKLFWPGTGTTGNELSFASYFPYAASVTNYQLTQDLSDQSQAPDYGFAWAKLENVNRPTPIVDQELTFDYKVAKLSFSIVGDETTVGSAGIKMQEGAQGEGIVSVKIYGASTGFYKDYTLDLLTGTPTAQTDITSAAPMTLKGVNQAAATGGKPSSQPYVDAVAYVAPSVDNGLKTDGIGVEIVYHDGTTAQTYTATIKSGASLSGDAALENGLVAGNNYKYTLKLGKSGITFTGKVTDWTDVEGGDIELQ